MEAPAGTAAERMIPDFWERHADDLTDYARPIYEAGRRALAWQYRAILSRNAAYAAAKRGDIPTIKIGKLLRVPVRALEQKLDATMNTEAA